MEEIIFKIQGSSAEPYTTTFTRTEKGIFARCTCMAGARGVLCKHRLAVLNGDTERIVSSNSQHVQMVQSWIKGTDIEGLVNQIADAESRISEAKKNLESAKATLSRLFK
jgi:hypothetical protein